MFIMPDNVHTNEEWIIWLLAEEFSGKATHEMLSQRMHLPPDQAKECIQRLEQVKAVSVQRDAETKNIILSVRLTPAGRSQYADIQGRRGVE
jgi:Mn-dependent DtxR family transcriptional regulator